LQAALGELLAFSWHVRDFILRPVVDAEPHAISPQNLIVADAFVQMPVDSEGYAYLIVIKDDEGRHKDWSASDLSAIEAWCGRQNAALSILTHGDIETAFLANVRELAPFRHANPALDGEPMQALFQLVGQKGSARLGDALNFIAEAARISPTQTEETLKCAIAQRYVFCDLTVPMTSESLISCGSSEDHDNEDLDPAIVMIKNGLATAQN
jgi:hypothetical protein